MMSGPIVAMASAAMPGPRIASDTSVNTNVTDLVHTFQHLNTTDHGDVTTSKTPMRQHDPSNTRRSTSPRSGKATTQAAGEDTWWLLHGHASGGLYIHTHTTSSCVSSGGRGTQGNACGSTQGNNACGGREATNANKCRTCATAPTHFQSNHRPRHHRYRRNEYARSCECTCCSACARVGTHYLGGGWLLRRRVDLSTRYTACSYCKPLYTLQGRILSPTPYHR